MDCWQTAVSLLLGVGTGLSKELHQTERKLMQFHVPFDLCTSKQPNIHCPNKLHSFNSFNVRGRFALVKSTYPSGHRSETQQQI
ncbi:hypothetical protein D910_00530 [Dendroctonus ponderosae]